MKIKKNVSKRKSMTFKHSYKYFCIALGVSAMLTGCAQSPWQQVSLPKLEADQYQALFNTVSQNHQVCNKRFDAEVTLSLKSSLKNESIKGYLATILPYRGKFIVTTPLGQPAYIATVNGKEFQSINVLNRTYQSGYTEDVIDELDLPQILKETELGTIIDGKITTEVISPNFVRLDTNNRGVWFSIIENDREEHILLQQGQDFVLERIIENKDSDPITITYTDHKQIGDCQQPQLITISGLSFGAEIEIQLEDILPQPLLTSRDFNVKVPTGFIRQSLRN